MTKLVVIGFDAPIPKRVYELAIKGELPNIAKLIKNGVFAENCLVPYPTITPPNWTTIATGAWPGTHGITDFHMHKFGMPLDETYQAFDSRDCKAEYIWEAAEKVGKKTIILNWPSSWPPRIKEGVHIGGAGLAINEWRSGLPHHIIKVSLALSQVYTTEEDTLGSPLKFEKVGGREIAKAPLVSTGSKYEIYRPREFYVSLFEENGKKGVELLNDDKESILARVFEGEWSENIIVDFETEKGVKRGGFRIKVLSASKERVTIFFTPIASLEPEDFPAYPAELVKRLMGDPKKMDGLPLPSHSLFRLLNLGLIDIDTWIEAIDLEHRWFAYMACNLMKDIEWDLFFMHAHCPDWAYHAFMGKLYQAFKGKDPKLNEYIRAEIEFYKSLDRMVGRIVKCGGEDTLVVLVSDHGAKSSEYRRPSIHKILADRGLASYKTDPVTGKIIEVDWSKTKAWPQRAVYIYVNLKGRDPNGIVDPKDYDKVRDEIIDALYSYVDPVSGKHPILFAIKKEDARMLGLYGESVGDIIYALNPEFSGEHGTFLPTAEYGVGSLKGLCIFSGPKIKKGLVLQRNMWLTDIVPTVCYLLDLPVPKDAEGSIIYQIFEDPNFKLNEINKLRNALKRLREAIEKETYLTHNYE
ncbi:MAG: hypothetical protein B6U94_01610 [Thermofilum sp. ex4484_79]|nr:MAG: hypothetical protein B6U94_01610 [Thermofilum sp. ex4484_79]